jgi:hypothetical protein
VRPTRAATIRLAWAGLGVALALGTAVSAAEPSATGAVPVIEHNSRSFRIPFNFDPEQKSEIKEIVLFVSEDQGRTWNPVERSDPDARAIAFKATQDGEFWFAVQTVSKEGRLYPPSTAAIEPKMKVVVDTSPPKLTLESNGRRGGLASVRWEVRDDRLDRNSFVLEFQTEGERDWRQVPVRRPVALIGEKSWDAGTADAIRVRAVVADRAKNTKEVVLLMPDGSPENPKIDRGNSAELAEPPPLGSFASNEVNGLPQFPSTPAAVSPPARRPVRPPQAPAAPTRPAPASNADYNPFEAPTRPSTAGRAARADDPMKPQLIASPKFNLKYEVEDAGPDGPAIVELWITLDGGRTWSPRGEDPDRKSPFPVDLGGDGTYGLTLVARSSSNLGDEPPAPGDRPQYLVEVDSTSPMVKLEPIRPGTGAESGRIVVIWHASDLHLGQTPVVVSVRAEGTTGWRPISSPIANTGRYVWTLPPSAPPRFYVRVDVVDSVGNRGSDETPDGNPVVVNRSRPKSRITGLEPATQSAAAPSTTPLQ